MANRLIEELKKDHAAITDMLTRAKGMDLSHHEAHEILISAKARLLRHLEREDRELYPVLHREAETNPSLKMTLDFYARDMDTVSRDAVNFLDKYAEGGSGIEFARDFARFFNTLSTRIRDEEPTIYGEYERLAGDP